MIPQYVQPASPINRDISSELIVFLIVHGAIRGIISAEHAIYANYTLTVIRELVYKFAQIIMKITYRIGHVFL